MGGEPLTAPDSDCADRLSTKDGGRRNDEGVNWFEHSLVVSEPGLRGSVSTNNALNEIVH